MDRLQGGQLDIACPASLGIDPLPALAAAFRHEFPDVALRVHDLAERQVGESELFNLGVDVVLTFAGLVSSDLHAVTLAPVKLVAVLRRPAPQRVSLDLLLTQGLVTTPADTAAHRFVAERVGGVALEDSIAVQVVHPEGVLPLVVSGAGAAILPAGHAQVAETLPGLVVRDLDPPAQIDVVVAIPRNSNSVAAHQFLRVCRDSVGSR